jgi:hypothetical protein
LVSLAFVPGDSSNDNYKTPKEYNTQLEPTEQVATNSAYARTEKSAEDPNLTLPRAQGPSKSETSGLAETPSEPTTEEEKQVGEGGEPPKELNPEETDFENLSTQEIYQSLALILDNLQQVYPEVNQFLEQELEEIKKEHPEIFEYAKDFQTFFGILAIIGALIGTYTGFSQFFFEVNSEDSISKDTIPNTFAEIIRSAAFLAYFTSIPNLWGVAGSIESGSDLTFAILTLIKLVFLNLAEKREAQEYYQNPNRNHINAEDLKAKCLQQLPNLGEEVRQLFDRLADWIISLLDNLDTEVKYSESNRGEVPTFAEFSGEVAPDRTEASEESGNMSQERITEWLIKGFNIDEESAQEISRRLEEEANKLNSWLQTMLNMKPSEMSFKTIREGINTTLANCRKILGEFIGNPADQIDTSILLSMLFISPKFAALKYVWDVFRDHTLRDVKGNSMEMSTKAGDAISTLINFVNAVLYGYSESAAIQLTNLATMTAVPLSKLLQLMKDSPQTVVSAIQQVQQHKKTE